MNDSKRVIGALIYKIEDTFRRDDLQSAPRESLERLINELYEDLTNIQLTTTEL